MQHSENDPETQATEPEPDPDYADQRRRWTETPPWLAEAFAQAASVAQFIADTRGESCVYCAAPARVLDHIIPQNVSGKTWRKRVPVVPCCEPCNYTLGDFPDPDIVERTLYIETKRTKKDYLAACKALGL